MHRLLAAAGVVTFALCGCAPYPEFDGPPPPAPGAGPPAGGATAASPAGALIYAPPTRGPAAVPSDVFAAKRFRIVRLIGDEAGARGLEVTHQDNSKGLVVARYDGPVLDYVDCGTYSAPAGGFSVPAVGSKLTRTIAASGAGEVNQNAHLFARLVALVERQGDEAASAPVEGQYVVRRDLIFLDDTGRELRRNREFIDLMTDEQASFPDGTACVATGVLERSVLPQDEVELGS